MDSQGKPNRYIALRSEISERKLAEAQLKETISQKEALLKEVYHRVKNNLQVVSSLINMQGKVVKSEEAQMVLKQSADRIKAMALLHEQLYQTKDLAKINVKDYIADLVGNLLYSFAANPDRIKMTLAVEAVLIDVDIAIPCGLIINELLSNTLKYAFPDGRSGEISIGFMREDPGYRLIFSDNGIGLPLGFNIHRCQSLGLQLVSSLTQQLMGELILEPTAKGTLFSLYFDQPS